MNCVKDKSFDHDAGMCATDSVCARALIFKRIPAYTYYTNQCKHTSPGGKKSACMSSPWWLHSSAPWMTLILGQTSEKNSAEGLTVLNVNLLTSIKLIGSVCTLARLFAPIAFSLQLRNKSCSFNFYNHYFWLSFAILIPATSEAASLSLTIFYKVNLDNLFKIFQLQSRSFSLTL